MSFIIISNLIVFCPAY